MNLSMNLLLPIVILGIAYAAWRIEKWQFLLLIPVFVIVYGKLQPSLPKNQISRTPVPGIIKNENAGIVDKVPKPNAFEQNVSEQNQKYKDGLTFIDK